MKEKLKQYALKVRQEIESDFSERGKPSEFPRGRCDIASIILGYYLVSLGYKNSKIVYAHHKELESHCWLLVSDKYIVDITADQFHDYSIAVTVEEKTELHNSFEVKNVRWLSVDQIPESDREVFNRVIKKL